MGKHRNTPSGRASGDGKPGYKNIEAKHQWKKGGPSPNPGGRRAGAPPLPFETQLWAQIEAVMATALPVRGDDGVPMTVLEGLVRRIFGEGVNDGKVGMKALEFGLAVSRLAASANDNRDGEDRTDDEQLIADALARHARKRGTSDV